MKVYRIEVETIWIHPEIQFAKNRKMVYDFTSNTLVANQREWADGQYFYDPKHSPHIYAEWDQADSIFSNLEWKLEDWEPFNGLLAEGTNEHINRFRMVSVDENGNEEIETENDYLGDVVAISEAMEAVK